jgi:hypothetical protein
MKGKGFTLGMVVLTLGLVLVTVSCTTVQPFYYSDNSAKDFNILGEVAYTGTITSILGFPPSGSAEFQELLNTAKTQYQADWVIDVTVDYEYQWLVFLQKWTYKMRGIAIKYK